MNGESFEYNNSAGRLYQHFKNISQNNAQFVKRTEFAKRLGIDANWEAIFNALIQMKEDFKELKNIIDDIGEANPVKFNLWNDKLKEIDSSLNTFACDISNDHCKVFISASAIVSLQFIAADLPKEVPVAIDQLEELRKLCDELRVEIAACDSISKTLKNWLLDLVRLMRDSIDRYKIRGSKGLKRDLHEMLGSFYDHEDYAAEAKKEAPTIWIRIMSGFEKMCKFGKTVDAGNKAISYVMKALESLPG